MPKNCFLTNFGGPGDTWHTSDVPTIARIDQECKQYYGPPTRHVTFTIQGLKVQVLTYGVHRALYVELPEKPSQKTINAYRAICAVSAEYNSKDYNILTHNCVTAVTALLHQLDPNLVPQYLVLPWTLDASLKKFIATENTKVMNPFFEVYEKNYPQKTYFSFISQRSKLRAMKSVSDVIKDAYHGEQIIRERTKSSLLELQWVIEDKQGVLHPTPFAPKEFAEGLRQFNYDYRLVTQLKNIVETHEIKPEIFDSIFQDNPDFSTALERIETLFKSSNPMLYDIIMQMIRDWQEANPASENYEIDAFVTLSNSDNEDSDNSDSEDESAPHF